MASYFPKKERKKGRKKPESLSNRPLQALWIMVFFPIPKKGRESPESQGAKGKERMGMPPKRPLQARTKAPKPRKGKRKVEGKP
jgi:hypothetical protein